MSAFEDLSTAERAEVDAAVRDAYIDGDRIRTHAEAVELFDAHIADAVQAHRIWAEALLDQWRRDGQAAFIARRWKALDGPVRMQDPKSGAVVLRNKRRGTKTVTAVGAERDVQLSLDLWDVAMLERGIIEATRRIDAERVTIANYRALLDLLSRTGSRYVSEALDSIGQSLDEFLAADVGAA